MGPKRDGILKLTYIQYDHYYPKPRILSALIHKYDHLCHLF